MQRQPQLNPFYIEQETEEHDTWDGDWEFDDEDLEEEGLLQNNRYEETAAPPPTSRRRQHVHSARKHHRKSASSSRPWLGVLVVVFFIYLLVALSEHKDTDEDEDSSSIPNSTVTLSPTSIPAQIPQTESPTKAPNKSSTNAPTKSGDEDNKSPTNAPTKSGDKDNKEASLRAPTAVPTSASTTIRHTETPTRGPTVSPTAAPHEATKEAEPTQGPTPAATARTIPNNTGIVILGERNSGVNWLQKQLEECFPEVSVKRTLSRSAAWFQSPPSTKKSREKRFILVVAVRNPVDWLWHMYKHPSYMPGHNHSKSIDGFLAKSWSVPDDGGNGDTDTPCQLNFQQKQVVPCHPEGPTNRNTPIYELDSNGKPFDNIAALRTAKIWHWMMNVTQDWSEEAINSQPILHHFENSLLEHTVPAIESLSNWQRQCLEDATATTQPGPDEASLAILKNWTHLRLDWDAEALIGYSEVTR